MHIDYMNILSHSASILFTIIVIGTIYVIITENRNPIKSIAWVIILALLPVVGFICYLFFGRNYRKQKLISDKSIKRLKKYPKEIFNINDLSSDVLTDRNKNLITLLYNSSESIAYDKNHIDIYTDGKRAFESVFTEIEKAKHHIHVQFFIVENDQVGNHFRELLIRKAKEGIKIRFIYDGLGSWKLKKKFTQSMKDAGIEVESFLRVYFPFFSNKVNYRNHRKVIVIDGITGFIGGMNVADRYVFGDELGMWRDTLIKIQGNAVHGLQNSFLIDWFFVNRTLIVSKEYYPIMTPMGNNLVQIVTSSPDSEWEGILQSFCKSIAMAKKYVYIETPYFLPPESLLSTLKIAALSGVDVRLIISENSDSKITNTAARSFLREVMDAGVKIYFYNKGFIHSKTIVIDDCISTVGSTNMDFRSFELHFEINAFIYNEEFAIKMRHIYEKDLRSSKAISLTKWKKREKWQKFKESVARLFSPLL